MLGSTYAPQSWVDLEASKVSPNVIGVQGSVTAGLTQSVDQLVADDSLIRSIQFLVRNANFGDKLSVSVVDKDGVYAPANTVLAAPVNNFNVNSDQQQQSSYDAAAPFKILGGLYIRTTYTSTGIITPVTVETNFLLLKILI